MVAALTHTPLPDVWNMTLGQITRYAKILPKLLQIANPFAGGEGEGAGDGESRPRPTSASGEDVVTDPDAIRAILGTYKIVPEGADPRSKAAADRIAEARAAMKAKDN